MNLQEIGDLLRSEREQQGLSLDEVVEKTKISRRNLEAIEAGRQEDLPHLVYARGFVKNYARLLKLDADQIGNALTQALGGEEDPFQDFQAEQASVPLTVRPTALRKVTIGLSAALVVAALGGAGYMILGDFSLPGLEQAKLKVSEQQAGQDDKGASEAKPREGSVPAQASASAPAAPAATTPTDDGASKAAAVAAQAKPAQMAAPADAKNSGKPASENAAPAAQAAGQTAATAPQAVPADKTVPADKKTKDASGKDNLVEITAQEPCWLKSLTDDDRKSREYFLKTGESVKLPFSKALMVKLGNAGGVSVTYNGKPYQFGAQPGQVRTISFP